MTANVITYRGRSAAREVGKALGFEPAQVDRLAKVMNQFEFIDPDRHAAAASVERRPGSQLHARPPVRPAVARDAGSAAPSRPALRRHGDLPGAARCGRAARERQHARPGRRAVGQGRLRRHGDREGRSARPRHDGRDPGRDLRWSMAKRASRLPPAPLTPGASDADAAPGRPVGGRGIAAGCVSIWRICRRTIRWCTRCCRRPTRLASSRWNRARRWRRCRG